MTLLPGKFVRTKGMLKKILLLINLEVLKQDDGSNKLRRIYSKKPSIQFFRENNSKKDLIVAEIGVWKGDNVCHMIEVLPIKKIYVIDPWIPFSSSEHDMKTMKLAERVTRKKLNKYGNRIQILKTTSDEAVGLIPENMDFIYIDGNHDYEYVKKDIENYYKKLRIGGILAGDDIQNRRIHNGVAKALAEFSVENKLDFFIEAPDWWLVKK
ncbi:MAG: class I SAM-dependent methyltransferase [archaeon]